MGLKRPGDGLTAVGQADSTHPEPNHVQICDRAADHIARARQALDDDSLDPAEALGHLDNAIACLKGLSRKGRPPKAKAENTVLAFRPGQSRRSA